MKKLILIVLCVVIGAACHANLPPNKVNDNVVKLDDGWFDKIFNSQIEAEWEFTDYGVVKFAESKRLKVTLIGYPFCDWQVYEPDKKSD